MLYVLKNVDSVNTNIEELWGSDQQSLQEIQELQEMVEF